MVYLAQQNDDHTYMLVTIDIFFCFAHCQPVKSKKGSDILQALQLVLSETRKPNMIRRDLGMEFRSKEVNKYLRDQNIHHFYTLNTETKANYAERIIKTLKHKLFRYMMKQRTQRYIHVLQDVVYSYNHTIRRSLGKTPATITKDSEGESRLQQYLLRQPNIKSKKRSKKNARKSYKF